MTGQHRAHQPSANTRRLVAWTAAGWALAAVTFGNHQNITTPVAPQPIPVVLVQPPPTPRPAATRKVTRVLKVVGRQGLTPNAVTLLNYIDASYPAITTVGGVRPDPLPDHPTGHAIDIMVTNQTVGDQICADLLAHTEQLNIRYVIWKQTLYRPSGSHYLMADRGSANANHYTHLHVTVR